jgi:pimeloyl-ACP methyl ester carboxylesterase
MTQRRQAKSFDPPPAMLTMLEPARAAVEAGWLSLMGPALLMHAPRGDGHPVVVLPGFLAGDDSTAILRGYLNALGYDARGWGLGPNLWPRRGIERATIRIVERLTRQFEKKVSLIGWSLGGILARKIAHKAPHAVRRVLTLGSPFRATVDGGTNPQMSALHQIMAGHVPDRVSASVPPVPCTAIYSRTDGIAVADVCIDPGDSSDNVAVPGSHSGLAHNPVALLTIAERLSEPEGV